MTRPEQPISTVITCDTCQRANDWVRCMECGAVVFCRCCQVPAFVADAIGAVVCVTCHTREA